MISYETTKKRLHLELQLMKKRNFMYALMRTSSLVLCLLFLWMGQYGMICYWIAMAFLVLFATLVYLHEVLKTEMLQKETKLEVIEKLNRRKNEEWKKETTPPWISENTMINDLDISGKNSLMKYMGMAHTPYGKEYLLSLFHKTSKMEEIRSRQQAVQELTQKPEELLQLQTCSALFEKHSKKIKREVLDQLIEHAGNEFTPSPLYILYIGMTILTIAVGLSCILFPRWFDILWILISINIILMLVRFTKNNDHLQEVSAVKDILEDYTSYMKELNHLHFQAPYLQGLQKKNTDALLGTHKLLQIAQVTKARSNIITNLLFNGLFLLDFHCVHQLAKWKKANGKQMSNWFQMIAEIEALISFAVLAQVKETVCFPELKESSTPYISFENLNHPLLSEKTAIANSLEIKNETYIITGSNMSGKTTFLRTIGINAALAMAGGLVCGESYQMSDLDIYTSMRIQDDVNEGISSFYGELLSIKKMMDASHKERPMMVLIDEIFKGTNSADRIMCAKEAISKLHQPWIITIVSTHDFELCSLDSTEIQAKNYHFEETYINDEIHFDYLLKKGKCTTTNAKELMKLAGF